MAERDMTEERAYYSAGYLIIEKCDRGEGMDYRILPPKIISASKCLSNRYPDAWGLNLWSPRGGVRLMRNKAMDKLNLKRRSLKKLRKWFMREFEAKNIQYPDIFLSLHTAKEFHRMYLQHIPDLELIGIGFSKETIDKHREDEKRDQMWQVASNRLRSEIPDAIVFTKERLEKYLPDEGSFKVREDLLLGTLLRFEPIDSSGIVLGFEILGDEGCYNFCSHICNGLETDLKEKLGVAFNENGFIDSFEDADRSAQYINQSEDAEPCDWYPSLIMRYDIH